MNEWWNALTPAAQFFWLVAIAASVFQLLLFAGSFIGTDDFDHSVDGPDGADGSGAEAVKVLSLRAIVAFLVGFGWVGGIALQYGWSVTAASIVALLSGIVFMGTIIAVMRLMMSMHADGTIDFANAVGSTGQVYVTIPPAKSGKGQVEILIQGRLATLQAITESPSALTPNTTVTVQRIESGNLLVVTPS